MNDTTKYCAFCEDRHGVNELQDCLCPCHHPKASQPSTEWEERFLELAFWKGNITGKQAHEIYIPFIRTLLSSLQAEHEKEKAEMLKDFDKVLVDTEKAGEEALLILGKLIAKYINQ